MNIFKNKNEPKSGNLLDCSEYIGSVCKVTTEKDTILFIGNVTAYNSEKGELSISNYKQEEITGILYDTPVKINIQKTSGVTIFYGNVRGQTKNFWSIEVKEGKKHDEQRGSFRQLLDINARIMSYGLGSAKNVNDDCILHDISITGLSFYSEHVFDVGDEILIYNAIISKETNTNYDFQCVISRAFENEDNKKIYGCKFKNMSSKVEKDLIKDIFYLQKQAMNQN